MSYEVKEADEIIKPDKESEFPFDDMEVNDYFEFEKEEKLINRLRTKATRYKQKTGKVFRVSDKTLTCQRIK